MHRSLNAHKILLLLSLCLFMNISEAEDVHELLRSALLCGANPLDRVRDLPESGSTFKNGYIKITSGRKGDDDVETKVTLQTPIALAGSQTDTVIAKIGKPYADFNGTVYSVFKGDYRKVVSALKLKPVKGSEFPVGKYVRSLNINYDGTPLQGSDVCPLIIGLSPLKKDQFVLGCGWCNG